METGSLSEFAFSFPSRAMGLDKSDYKAAAKQRPVCTLDYILFQSVALGPSLWYLQDK